MTTLFLFGGVWSVVNGSEFNYSVKDLSKYRHKLCLPHRFVLIGMSTKEKIFDGDWAYVTF